MIRTITQKTGARLNPYWRASDAGINLVVNYGSNILINGTATASSELDGGYIAAYAFDGNDTTRWHSAKTSFPHWIKYDLGSSITKIVNKIKLKTYCDVNGARVKDIVIEGSNNNTDWTTLDSISMANNGDAQNFIFSTRNSIGYRYYRWTINDAYYTEAATFYLIEAYEEV